MEIFNLTIFGITFAPKYYGLMYALGFLIGYLIIKKRGFITGEKLDDLFIYLFLGVVFGGRLGYVLFYNFSYYLENFLEIFKVWQGGMSFHGGVIGVAIAVFFYTKKYKINIWKLGDEIASVLPIGLFFGRIGNFLNKELLGFSPYHGFLAVEKNGKSYFPSPLLEAFLEGIVLFCILYFIYKNKKFNGEVLAVFLIGYGIFRIFVEMFFRAPDVQIGYILGYFTMGEILSLPMIFIGAGIYFFMRKK
ncbi:prolipoprotein diacylglyceryl transferase [Candidatus Gracilibacteria bacterium]|nr:prolipoprotein diacylglyceryl transferase [Candidatus Gracilibacteria bacterium]